MRVSLNFLSQAFPFFPSRSRWVSAGLWPSARNMRSRTTRTTMRSNSRTSSLRPRSRTGRGERALNSRIPVGSLSSSKTSSSSDSQAKTKTKHPNWCSSTLTLAGTSKGRSSRSSTRTTKVIHYLSPLPLVKNNVNYYVTAKYLNNDFHPMSFLTRT